MLHIHPLVENKRHPGLSSLCYFRSERLHQGNNFMPLDISARRMGENGIKRFLMLSFHVTMVPLYGTLCKDLKIWTRESI